MPSIVKFSANRASIGEQFELYSLYFVSIMPKQATNDVVLLTHVSKFRDTGADNSKA